MRKREREQVSTIDHRSSSAVSLSAHSLIPLHAHLRASNRPTLRVGLGAPLHQPDRVLGEGLELLAEVHLFDLVLFFPPVFFEFVF